MSLRWMLRVGAFAVTFLFVVDGARADFLDLSAVSAGISGTFDGTLGGVAVHGAITTSNPDFSFGAAVATVPPFISNSVTTNTSQQYSYSSVFSDTIALTDQIGYTFANTGSGTARVTINFSSPLTNPIFDVANLDSMFYDFTPTAGLSGLTLLKGNGGAGDGLQVIGKIISDINPATLIAAGQNTNQAPFTSGARSAYGSIALVGTFNTLVFDVTLPNHGGDGGSFTLSTAAPTPAVFSGATVLLGGLAARRRVRFC